LYVGRIDARTNTIALGAREEVSSRSISADCINVLIPDELARRGGPACEERLFGKIRSYGDPRSCRIVEVSRTDIKVEFDEPQFAPCPGQRLVLYDEKDNIVAGGTIIAPAK
jgi:tRNA-specific 2-thiouridylase